MANLFERAKTWLPEQMQRAAVSGNTLTLTLGVETIDLTDIAWPGRTVFSSNVEGAARIEFGDRDYLVPATAIVFASDQIEPQIGMRFRETIEGVVRVFEVITPDTGEPAWRYSDPGLTVWRIHTKEVTE
jgi:hypothetical protein